MRRKVIRWSVRLLLLGLAVFLALGGPLPAALKRLFPALSPLVVFSSSLAQRQWYAGFFWGIPPLLFLGLAVWRGRFFCRWICPAGTVYAVPAKWNLHKKVLPVRISGVIFWAIVSSSAVGYPIFLLLDPMATFNRLASLPGMAFSLAALIPGLVLPLFLVLGFFQPFIWCAYICPLGYLFDVCHAARKVGPAKTVNKARRQLLGGVVLGLALAFCRKFFFFETRKRLPVLPPGAKDPETFALLCTCCYACVNVCPTQVIQARFHPEMDFDRGYCLESCNECSQVCPAGALTALTGEQKRLRQIGIAQVKRSACLAWADGLYCMVCQEFCPYNAVETNRGEGGIPRPVVNPQRCRGCGACQNHCPAIREGKAIIVHGVERQNVLKETAGE